MDGDKDDDDDDDDDEGLEPVAALSRRSLWRWHASRSRANSGASFVCASSSMRRVRALVSSTAETPGGSGPAANEEEEVEEEDDDERASRSDSDMADEDDEDEASISVARRSGSITLRIHAESTASSSEGSRPRLKVGDTAMGDRSMQKAVNKS